MRGAFIIIITMMLGFFALANSVMADEWKPKEIDVDYSVCEKETSFIKKEWCETKEYQKVNFQKGKEQTSENWNNIKSFFSKLTNKEND